MPSAPQLCLLPQEPEAVVVKKLHLPASRADLLREKGRGKGGGSSDANKRVSFVPLVHRLFSECLLGSKGNHHKVARSPHGGKELRLCAAETTNKRPHQVSIDVVC